jgi:hypothetical protein
VLNYLHRNRGGLPAACRQQRSGRFSSSAGSLTHDTTHPGWATGHLATRSCKKNIHLSPSNHPGERVRVRGVLHEHILKRSMLRRKQYSELHPACCCPGA